MIGEPMMEVLPPEEMKRIVLETAVEAGVPGCSDKALYDARPHLNTIVEALYVKGFALSRLIDSEKGRILAKGLSQGQTIPIK